jgi:hypothetical protein
VVAFVPAAAPAEGGPAAALRTRPPLRRGSIAQRQAQANEYTLLSTDFRGGGRPAFLAVDVDPSFVPPV